MIEFPDVVMDVVKAMAFKYPKNPNRATQETIKKIKKMDVFESLLDDLIFKAVQELIWDARHQANREIKKAGGGYSGPAKVNHGGSAAMKKIYISAHFSLRIGGSLLGMTRGEELEGLALNEAGRSNGHAFNARLLQSLIPLVPANKTVLESVSSKRLDQEVAKAEANK